MINRWWEIKIVCASVLEETIFWRLEQFGCRGMATEVKSPFSLIRSYLPETEATLLDLAALSLSLRQDAIALELPSPKVQWDLMDEEDWAASWKEHWEPMEIGDRLLICPAWLTPPETTERLVLLLDPGSAFGTGVHPTTQLCLEALEMRFSDPANQEGIIADVGCGSGILSIAGLQMGAKKAYAVDTDVMAVRATQHNSQLNQIDPSRLVVEQGSILELMLMADEPMNGFVCNILAEVIVELMPQFSAIATPKTWGILSGILLEQAQMIANAIEENDWVVATLWKRQEWCCFNIRRS